MNKKIICSMIIVFLIFGIAICGHCFRNEIKNWFVNSEQTNNDEVLKPDKTYYSVKFIVGEDEYIQFIAPNSKLSKPTYQKDGYVVENWYSSYNNEVIDFDTFLVTQDVIITANLVKMKKINFHIGTEIITNFIKPGDPCPIPNVPNKGDQKFIYFSLVYNGGDPVNIEDYILNEDFEEVTFYAQFENVLNGKLLNFGILNGEIFSYSGTSPYLSLPKTYSIEKGYIVEGTDYEVTSIADNAFKNNEVIKTVNIGTHIVSVGNSAFYNCKNLEAVVMSDSLVNLGESAFANCSNLIKIQYFSKNLKELKLFTFQSCSKLKEIELPESVEIIGAGVFISCTSLTNVRLPRNLTKIGVLAFANCSSLKSIVLPANVKELGGQCFGHNENLTIYMNSSIPPVVEDNMPGSNIQVIVDDLYYDAYVNAGWLNCTILKRSEV